MYTFTEENYLKAIYKLSDHSSDGVSTNSIAEKLSTKAASVTDMLKKLADKGLIEYKKYQGVKLSPEGNAIAVQIIRKHRLWETFLVEKLSFKWDEVHNIAEQLEHIQSDVLIDRLDSYLGHPRFDPHGDPIPTLDGKFHHHSSSPLSEINQGSPVLITGVIDHSPVFLQHLEKLGLTLGTRLMILEKAAYDQSMLLELSNETLQISNDVAKNLLVVIRAEE